MSRGASILSIDLGTSGPKVALVTDRGEILARAVRPVRTTVVAPNGAEQDAVGMWGGVVEGGGQVLREAAGARETICGVVCDSHYFSIVPVDAHGDAIAPCVTWMDERGGRYALELYERQPDALERWIDVHGMPPLPSGNDSLSHILFLRAERPEIYDRTHAFVEPMDYLAAKLSGTVAANARTAFALLLTDNRRIDDVRYDDGLVAAAGIDREKLPGLLPPGEPVGVIRDAVADEIGLPRGVRIFSGMNDTQSIAVGAGTFRDGWGGINVGTTTQVLAHVDTKRADLDSAILSMPSALPRRYMVLAENGLGGKLLEHFVLNIVFPKDAFADHTTADAYRDIERVLAGEPPGSGGVLFLPWYSGLLTPIVDPFARGAFLNLSLATTRASMLRALAEGVAFNMRWTLQPVERLCGGRFAELRFSGGGAVSDEWSQIMADVTGRPVWQAADARYLNSRAAAFLGFLEAGLTDLDQLEHFCPMKARYEPRAEHRDTYERLFEQFAAAHERNRPMFAALNA